MNLELLGCTPQKINQFEKRNIFTVEDLLKSLPRKYLDFRNPKSVKDLVVDEYASVILKIVDIKAHFKKVDTIILHCIDSKGYKMDILYFNMSFLAPNFLVGKTYIFCGKVSINTFAGRTVKSMVNPTKFSSNPAQFQRIVPVYPSIAGMSETYYEEKVNHALSIMNKEDYLEPELINKYNLLGESDAVRMIHQPSNEKEIESAQTRLLFDDLFFYNYVMLREAEMLSHNSKYRFAHYSKTNKLLASLPFKLTDGQRQVLREITETTLRNERVNAVVLGDVGCGKTLVAELCMLMAHDEGYQSVLVAPTVVLANQHYKDVSEKMEKLGVKCALLTSQTKAREKKQIMKDLKDGKIHMAIGTHSLLNAEIEFKDLALVIIDEEHKFGVNQRDTFNKKAKEGVHTISMSATPIPRTLALTMYGEDKKVYTIKTLPNGRKPIATVYKKGPETALPDLETQLKQGRQAYIVCPLIETSSDGKMKDVKSSTDMYNIAKKYFNPKGYKVAHINAKMKQDEINDIINEFADKKYDVLVSTTIIEIGINVPNATVIYIANAERFGLAQLHQLRGRVGRGSHQGYCLLESSLPTEASKMKIDAMRSTNDGFVISCKDLEMRGTGDFIGTTQSGDNKYVSLMLSKPELNKSIKEDIKEILKDDGRRAWYERELLLKYDEYQKN